MELWSYPHGGEAWNQPSCGPRRPHQLLPLSTYRCSCSTTPLTVFHPPSALGTRMGKLEGVGWHGPILGVIFIQNSLWLDLGGC